MKIEKKIWPKEFKEVLERRKNFELRADDFECNEGDILVLKEWDPVKNEYTGRKVEREITYVLKTKNQKHYPKDYIEKHGLQIIQLK